jgi:3-oxoacyl-[acyl-carrier-protein] synthase III
VNAYISDIGHAVGERFPIADLPEVKAAGTAERLAAEGLDSVRVSDAEPWELAALSAERTLESRAGTDLVGSVFYATDSFTADSANVKAPARFLDRLGLGRVPLRGVGLEGCANAGALLMAAGNAVAAGVTPGALCVTTDRAVPGGRLMGANVSVLSDGAASCLVRGEPPATGFRLVAFGSAVEGGMYRLSVATDTMAVVKATAAGIGRAVSEAFDRATLDRGAVSHVVCNNYGRTSLKIFCAAAQVPFDALFTGNIARMGHCFAADTLINLASLAEGGTISPGERCLTLWSGFNNWSAAIVEYVR